MKKTAVAGLSSTHVSESQIGVVVFEERAHVHPSDVFVHGLGLAFLFLPRLASTDIDIDTATAAAAAAGGLLLLTICRQPKEVSDLARCLPIPIRLVYLWSVQSPSSSSPRWRENQPNMNMNIFQVSIEACGASVCRGVDRSTWGQTCPSFPTQGNAGYYNTEV